MCEKEATGTRGGSRSAEGRIVELGLRLPPAPKPGGVYRPSLVVGGMIYVSGHGPYLEDGGLMKGKVGEDMDEEGGKAAARQVGLAILSTLRKELGSLDRIDRVVKVLGMVNCTADFRKQPAVVNGCSELFVEVFGTERGVGVRSAVGMGSLPEGIAVEVEAQFLLR